MFYFLKSTIIQLTNDILNAYRKILDTFSNNLNECRSTLVIESNNEVQNVPHVTNKSRKQPSYAHLVRVHAQQCLNKYQVLRMNALKRRYLKTTTKNLPIRRLDILITHTFI